MDCKISMPSAQTAHWLKKNAQMFIKARLNDDDEDDDDVSMWGVMMMMSLNWQTFLKLRNICSVTCHFFKFVIPVFWSVRAPCRLTKTKLVLWQSVLISCPNSRQGFSPLCGRELVGSLGWGCRNSSFGDSSCVIGFVLPQDDRMKAEPGMELRWQICKLKNINSVIVLVMLLAKFCQFYLCWETLRACWSQWQFCHQFPRGVGFCLLFNLAISSWEHMGANAKVLNWRSQ